MSGSGSGQSVREDGHPVAEDLLGRLLIEICQTPAPTFEEERRAALVTRMWREAGLEPTSDGVGNVVAEVPGGEGPRVLLAAHLDTVFSAEVDVTVRRQGTRWSAPGIGDNSASLALLTYLLRERRSAGLRLPRITAAATVGEEGLGDLRGARSLVEERGDEFDFVVAIDGHLSTIVDVAVGSKRFRVELTAQGGHSWGDFPAPSAVHALGAMVASLEALKVSRQPRSSYNIGQVWGGTGVNAIAQRAGFNLDLRSVDSSALDELERDALARFHKAARRHRVDVTIEKVGDRPAATVDNRRLVSMAQEALAAVSIEGGAAASSTDANVAMAAGIPAIAFGVYAGGDAHRMSEWLERPSLEVGYRALTGLLARLAGEPGQE
ncbi:MAG TPA: M20/M25/M40 family metallo-hydrolase [Trueperaceae bacterium]